MSPRIASGSRSLRLLIPLVTAALLVPLIHWPVPPASAAVTVTLDGRGFGHGIGMSQYGAKGRADAGHTHTQILSAYYPGTTAGTISDAGTMRVWIQGDTDRQTWVRAEPALRVRTDSGEALLPDRVGGALPTTWRIRTGSGGLILEALVAGTWRDHGDTTITGVLAGRTSADFVATDGTVQLIFGTTYREYRGLVRAVLVPGSTSDLRSVVVSTVSDYLASVVPAEMPAGWAAAALRAQAVAARTYAVFDRGSKQSGAWYDTCDTTSCQVYQGSADYDSSGRLLRTHTHPNTTAAVSGTTGQVLLWNGAPAFTQFSASNGGYSVQGSQPYLRAMSDPFDAYPEWQVTLTGAQIQAAYPTIGTFRSMAIVRDGLGSYGGRATAITLSGSQGSTEVSGAAFRSTFGLRSTLFRAGVDGVPLPAPQRDWDGDDLPDLLARGSDGRLFLYSGRENATWGAQRQIGHGWGAMGVMTQAYNFDGTRRPHILAIRSTTAELLVYTGDGRGSFAATRTLGRGWSGFDILVGVQDWAGPGTGGVIARQSRTGYLFYYQADGRGGLSAARLIGQGWSSMNLIIAAGDWDRDGRVDLMARHRSSGELYLYRGDGRGGFLASTRIGTGWSGMDAIVGAADWDHDGNWDLIARQRTTGVLWLYPSDESGRFRPNRQIGHGWTGFELIR